MLAWLALVMAVLISALVFMPGDAAGMQSIPGLAVAASVLAILIALYVAASSRSHTGIGRSGSRRLTFAGIAVAALALAAFALKDNVALSSLVPEAMTGPASSPSPPGNSPAAVRIRRDDSGKFVGWRVSNCRARARS